MFVIYEACAGACVSLVIVYISQRSRNEWEYKDLWFLYVGHSINDASRECMLSTFNLQLTLFFPHYHTVYVSVQRTF